METLVEQIERAKRSLDVLPAQLNEARRILFDQKKEVETAKAAVADLEAELLALVSAETNEAGKPLFTNKEAREAEVRKRLKVNGSYQLLAKHLDEADTARLNAELHLNQLQDEELPEDDRQRVGDELPGDDAHVVTGVLRRPGREADLDLYEVKGTKNRGPVADLMRHLLSDPVVKQLLATSPAYVVPAYKNLWKDPLVQNDRNAKAAEPIAFPADYFPGLRFPGPSSPAIDTIGGGTLFTDAMAEILQGKAIPDVVRDYEARMVQIFQDLGKKGR